MFQPDIRKKIFFNPHDEFPMHNPGLTTTLSGSDPEDDALKKKYQFSILH